MGSFEKQLFTFSFEWSAATGIKEAAIGGSFRKWRHYEPLHLYIDQLTLDPGPGERERRKNDERDQEIDAGATGTQIKISIR